MSKRNRDRKKPSPARGFGPALLCAALLLSLTACGGGEDETGVPALREGDIFTLSVAQQPDSLNPVVSQGGLTEEFFLLCYDPLWRVTAEGQPEPCLAESWSLSSDSLTWTIRIRRDAVFADGVPLTARDVLFSYDLMRRNSTVYEDYFDGVTAIRCPDDYTVVISTEYIKNDMYYNPTPILPKHIWESYEFSPAEFDNAALVGSGPFVYCPDESGEDGWMFRARETYFGGAARLGGVYFMHCGTPTGAARAVSSGEADGSYGLTDVQLTTLEGVPNVQLIETMLPQAECRAVAFNTRSEFFAGADMRKAVEYCADKEWFLSMYSGGAGMTGSSFLSPGSESFYQAGELRSYDPQRALGMMGLAGYVDTDMDGILEYGEDRTPFTVTLCTSSQDLWSSTAATILKDDLESIGVQVDWEKTDEPIESVCTADGDWDMCLVSWQSSQSAATAATMFMERMQSLTGWENEDFENTLNALRATRDDSTALAYAQQLQQIVYDQCPAAVLAYGADVQAIRNDNWTGYESILTNTGSLFANGSYDMYMQLIPLSEIRTEEEPSGDEEPSENEQPRGGEEPRGEEIS